MSVYICPKCRSDNSSGEVIYYGGENAYCQNCKSTFSTILIKQDATDIVQSDINTTNENSKQSGAKRTEIKPPIKSKINSVSIFTGLALILLIVVLVNGFKSCENTATSIPSTNASYQEERKIDAPDNMGAYVISQNFVKDNIVSPTTADFPMEPTNVKSIGNKFMVASYLDAQNAYGAVIREKYLCYQVYNGGSWSNKENWTLMSLIIGDNVAYINKNKTQQEIANDIDYLRTH